MVSRFPSLFLGTVLLLGTALLAVGEARSADGVAGGKLITRLYPIADLLPAPQASVPAKGQTALLPSPVRSCSQGTCCGCPSGNVASPHSSPPAAANEVLRLIVNTIEPQSWNTQGGPAAVEYCRTAQALLVRQTPMVHEQIADVLAGMRRLQATQVAVEVRIMTLSEPCFAQCRRSAGLEGENQSVQVEVQPDPGHDSPPSKGSEVRSLTFLTQSQLKQFMDAAQGDMGTNVMQAPRLVVGSGKTTRFSATDQQYFVTGIDTVQVGNQIVCCPRNEAVSTGVVFSVQPVVSADRRFVRLDLDMTMTSPTSTAVPLFPVVLSAPAGGEGTSAKAAPGTQYVQQPTFSTLALRKTVSIPDGGTVLVGGWKRMSEGRNEFGPPVLSKIPYVNRLYKNVGYGNRSELVLLMVTPRILVPSEEECHPPMVGTVAKAAGKPAAALLARRPGTGGTEEQERGARSECPCHCSKETPTGHSQSMVAELLARYHRACSAGHLAEATQAAVQALALDPACFSNQPEPRPR
jgi:Flp pilus assembly secretin CpaC